jgi:GR25 family glycosyltransferase involved in LPS biosynthesis
MNNIKYYYINLDSRQDRNNHIINQFKQYNITNYSRISAHKEIKRPALGCTLSHINTIQQFIDSKDPYCIILEDDFKFKIAPEQYSNMLSLALEIIDEWNIILLAGNVLKCKVYNEFLNYCLNVQTTSGYLIKKEFAPILLNNFTNAYNLSTKTVNSKTIHIDRHWKKLQRPRNKFFIFRPKCGVQLPGFSDILRKKVNYRS